MCLFAPFLGIPALFGGASAAAAGGATAAAGAGSGLSAALQGIGILASAAGSVAAGSQANKVAEYNAKVAENNAVAAQQSAAYEAGLTRENVRRVIGAQRAAGASSGLDTTSGTPVAVLGDTAQQGEMDVLAQLYSGNAAAVGYRNDARRMKAEGRAQKQAGFINAGTSLLSGFGQMAANRKYSPLGA